ncbi:MAG TPA: hypothetical protein VE843_06525 [Ktedonobacteraceae bacterium]|nr:hypothetical protein [Ktedonobacteraceae bacterium]
MGAIDFLSIRILQPWLKPNIEDQFPQLTCGTAHQPMYSKMLDLTPLGVEGTLHYKHLYLGHSKLQIRRVSEKPLSSIVTIISQLITVDPLAPDIMRLDVKVDVPDYPVSFFKQYISIPYKKRNQEWATIKSKSSNPKKVETLEFGARPNLYKVYDKVAERLHSYSRYLRRAKKKGLEPQSFESLYGHPPTKVLTRIERQFGKVPPEVNTLVKLKNSADTWNPFHNNEFLTSAAYLVLENDLAIKDLIVVDWLRQKQAEVGLQQLKTWIRKQTGSNANRFFKAFLPYLALKPLSPPDLNSSFKQELLQQISS